MSDELASTLTPEQRAAAAAAEIQAEIRQILEALTSAPVLVQHPARPGAAAPDRDEALAALEAHRRQASLIVPQAAGRMTDWSAPLARLAWLLGMSDGERAFVRAAADARVREDADRFETLAVYADWLEESGRPADAGAVRRLALHDGDVVVLYADATRYCGEAGYRAAVHGACNDVEAAARTLGLRVFCTICASGVALTRLSPQAMQEAGWRRAEEFERQAEVIADLRAKLRDAESAAHPHLGSY